MKKAEQRRLDILNGLADHVLAKGLPASSVRPLAEAAGISDRMLLYYFRDKSELIAATLQLLSTRLTAVLDAHTASEPMPLDALRRRLAVVLLSDDVWPYMQLWLEIVALSARGDPFYRAVGGGIARAFLEWGKAQLHAPTATARAADAARLLVSIEGMVLLKSVGLEDIAKASLRGSG
ncbi:MAG: TetR/AcrR family transcriptional regulator [Hyphomonadaceae bacterium]|nr:TetR/AcrR family transcriptional regulator [Hyphomonadaceae bacterium]